jgi:PAS domain S-box-containing protein
MRPNRHAVSAFLENHWSAVAGAVVLLAALVSALAAHLWPLAVGTILASVFAAAVFARRARASHARFERVALAVTSLVDDPGTPLGAPGDAALDAIFAALRLLRGRLRADVLLESPSAFEVPRVARRTPTANTPLTRSGLFESPAFALDGLDPSASGDFSNADMVSRLHPESLRWVDASAAAQEFLGWPIGTLRAMSFLDIVHADHRDLAREQLHASMVRGEAHGLIYRIRTASGEPKAIEMNVGVRYGADMRVSYLRCHITDVTAKLQASRELRRRTREVAQANEQLRHINRELAELKDRYGDLYENAPAMYFSLDPAGKILACNDTLLSTLGYRREDLVGQPFDRLLPASHRSIVPELLAESFRTGRVEYESRWLKADGSALDVWVTGNTERGPDGHPVESRGVAQDMTALRVLEAQLNERNDRLARTNAELSRKNKELDEFTYVVSHDLQEPLRTLIAFSDFLLKDYGDRLDEQGQEYIRFLVEASRRMRALIQDLLNLSRAGRVTEDFHEVCLDSLFEILQADFGELIRTRNARLDVRGPLPCVWGDRDRLRQLFGNLVSNGLKYNQAPEPRLMIGVEPAEQDGWTTLYVRDNGIGIDPQFHARIFLIFRRLHARDAYEGTGAGLAICQKIVLAHGGRMWLSSQLGQGATFFVTLPTSPPESTSVPALEESNAS